MIYLAERKRAEPAAVTSEQEGGDSDSEIDDTEADGASRHASSVRNTASSSGSLIVTKQASVTSKHLFLI